MFVGDEYGIEGVEVDSQHLLTEVGTAVNEYAFALYLHQ
jgi:hypothetical protein